MDCFVSNVPVDPSLLVVDLRGVAPEDDSSVIVRCHLGVREVVDATEGLFARFVEDTLAREALEPASHRVLYPARLGPQPLDLRSQLSLGLRLFREHLAREFLETLLESPSRSPRYALCSLDELRGTGDRIVFSGTARVLDLTS